jgi:hypothetical protein
LIRRFDGQKRDLQHKALRSDALRQDKPHPHVPLGHAAAGRGHAELKGKTAGGVDPFPDVPGYHIEMRMARIDIGPGIDDTDERFFLELVNLIPRAVEKLPRIRLKGKSFSLTMGALFGFFIIHSFSLL